MPVSGNFGVSVKIQSYAVVAGLFQGIFTLTPDIRQAVMRAHISRSGSDMLDWNASRSNSDSAYLRNALALAVNLIP